MVKTKMIIVRDSGSTQQIRMKIQIYYEVMGKAFSHKHFEISPACDILTMYKE